MPFPCLSINGTATPDQYVRVPMVDSWRSESPSSSDTGSISFLCKISQPDQQRFLFMGTNGSDVSQLNGAWTHGVAVNPNGTLRVYLYSDPTNWTTTGTIPWDTWFRLTFAWQQGWKVWLFRNDVNLGEYSTPSAWPSVTYFYFGKGGPAGPDASFLMADLRTSGYIIIPTDPSFQMGRMDPFVLSQEIAVRRISRYYRIDEGAGTALINLGGPPYGGSPSAGDNALITNATWTTTPEDPTYTSSPPTAPSNIVVTPQPVVGTTGDQIPAPISITWTGSTDPDNDPITYRGAISFDGGSTWTNLFVNRTQTSWAGQMRVVANVANALVRIGADAPGSPTVYGQSAPFAYNVLAPYPSVFRTNGGSGLITRTVIPSLTIIRRGAE